MSFLKNKVFSLLNNFLIFKKFFYLFFIPLVFYAFSLFFYIKSFDLRILYDDISAFYNLPIYAGIFTILGIFLWVSVLAICIFTRNLLLKNKHKNKSKLVFFNYACLFNFILLIDDQFLLHEKFYPNEIYIYFLYFVMIVLMFTKLKNIVVKKEIIYLSIALVFFLGSIAIDEHFSMLFLAVLGKFLFPNVYILENIFKFIGIYYWLIFFGTLSSRIISEEIKFRLN